MRGVLRVLGRLALWLLVLVAGFAAAVFFAVLVSAEDSDQLIGAIVLVAAALVVVAAAVWGLRRTRRLWPGKDDHSRALAGARERLRAGEPLVLRPSRRRWVGLLACSIALTAVCGWAFVDEPNVAMAVGALLFGAGIVIAVLQLVPGSASLRIAPEGLLARGPIRSGSWSWNEIEHFSAYDVDQYGTTQQVGFELRALTPDRQGVVRTIARGMTGVDAALPDTYGMRAEDLATLLEEAHERYATQRGMSTSERADSDLAARAARVRKDRLPLVTALLGVACAAVYVLEATRYGVAPDSLELLDAGGASRDEVADDRWWTLLTANVVHANLVHVVLNLIGLALLGTLLEREVGWPRFAALCITGGVAAMGLAVLLEPDAVVVGVSGVIFAIAGWAVLRDPHRSRALGTAAWGMLPVGVIYTLLAPNISIGAHVGGLLVGLACGYTFEHRLADHERRAIRSPRFSRTPGSRAG
jgi:membrane associated rhomboid family serine protease